MTQFLKNTNCEDRGVQLEDYQIVETSSYVYLGRSMNMENDLKEELNKRMRAAWAAFAPVRRTTDGFPCPSRQFSQRSITKQKPGQTPLPLLGNYSLLTEPLRDVF
ncbi:hypothetical protein RB195_024427 [Necator americanus]